MKTATDIFQEAVALIESKSIKVWVMIPKHRQAWIEYVQKLLDEGKTVDPVRLSTFIVITAIG